MGGMLRICLLLLCAAAAPAAPAAAQSVLSGPVRVVDGDTIDIGWRESVRLVGIDAPEGDQPCRDGAGRERRCGDLATAWARDAWEGRTARCLFHETDRYGRPLGVCAIGGEDLNAAIVRAGWAVTYRDDLRYDAEEKEAIFAGRGVHAYAMAEPHEWRAAQRARAADRNAPTGACRIKGNISDRGRIYHVPGQRSYGPTRISEARGERWFCTEAEARDAGWRRSGSN